MKPPRRFVLTLLGLAALCVAMDSAALTLGRAKGAVFLGQSLSLVVAVQVEAGENPSTQCFEADVFYGDTRQDAGRVTVSSTLQPNSQSAQVVIASQAPVDEPVVTLYLRAGCENKASRRYVMLAEVAPTAAPPAMSASAAPGTLPVGPQARVSDRAAVRTPRKVAVAPSSDAVASEPLPPPRSQPAAAAKPAPTGERRARLKLAPLDLTQERDPSLKLSGTLAAEEGEDLQKRARAAALWRSLNATPEDAQEAENRRRALETDLKGLHAITAKNRQLLDDMTQRLGEAEAGRYSNPLVYGLLAGLVLCALLIAFVWNRMPRGGLSGAPWWRDEGVGDAFDSAYAARSGTAKKNAAVLTTLQPPGATAIVDIDLPVDEPVAPGHPQPQLTKLSKDTEQAVPNQVASRAAGHVDFGHSMSATLLRSVNSKEMLDVRQQAEFFLTLGQHDEAVALLRDSVEACADANPLVFLELLKVLHTLGRKADFDHYRTAFNAIFNGHVPAYATFNESGSGLEAYPQVCQRIVASWPTEEAVSYIENSLVRTRRESGGQDFDLEAFRDLLMLHGVASRIASTSFDSGFMAFSALKTAPMPVSVTAEAGVDLDLSEPRDGNLIDFDASGWSPPANGSDKGNRRR